MKKEPDWARWRAWLIAASATAVPSGVTAACGGGVHSSCGYFGDSGVVDGASDSPAPVFSTCVPRDVSSFVPTWKPPAAFHQGVCTDVQAAAFVDCLNHVPDAVTCKAFAEDAANKACISCATPTPASAPEYGPLVVGTFTFEVNEPGCVARASGDVGATGCGAAAQAARQCEEFACKVGCSRGEILVCEGSSDTSVCRAYADAAACANVAEANGGPASVCRPYGVTFAYNAEPMVKLFCGGIIGDGGVGDAGDAG